jgi:branched-chain amino acid transport system ATP-binding protein
VLQLHDLSRNFGRLAALNSVSFDVKPGAIQGLIGPNGSGKTTLFNLVSGFLRPSGGRVLWKGRDITGLPPHLIARAGLARTFQMTSNYANLSVVDNLVMASRNRIVTPFLSRLLHLPGARREEEEHRDLAREVLAKFALGHLADVPASALPGGTQKILGVAIALATAPELLLLDEPLAGLNPGEKVQLTDILLRLRQEGVTILIIEHDMKAIMRTCEHVTVLCYGQLLAEGTPAEISKHPATIKAYLGENAA